MLVYFTFMDEDGFTLVKGGRQNKKQKAEGSPLLYLPPGSSSAGPSDTPARPNPFSVKNTIPVILRDVDSKFNNKVKLIQSVENRRKCVTDSRYVYVTL